MKIDFVYRECRVEQRNNGYDLVGHAFERRGGDGRIVCLQIWGLSEEQRRRYFGEEDKLDVLVELTTSPSEGFFRPDLWGFLFEMEGRGGGNRKYVRLKFSSPFKGKMRDELEDGKEVFVNLNYFVRIGVLKGIEEE